MAHRGAAHRVLSEAVLVGGVVAALVAGCATGLTDHAASCDAAFAQAMTLGPTSNPVHAIDGAIATCPSLTAWVAAARQFPQTAAGQDPVGYAIRRCAASSELAGARVCEGLPSNQHASSQPPSPQSSAPTAAHQARKESPR